MPRRMRASRYKIANKPFIAPARRFLNTAEKLGSRPAYFVREEKGWAGTPWNVYKEEVRRVARALVALGVKPGDVVGIFAYTRPEWIIADLAIMMVGAAPAGIYFTCSPQDVAYIVQHSQCEIVIAERQEHFDKIKQERANLNCLRHVVMMKGAPATDPLQMKWEDFCAKGEDSFDAEVERRLQATEPKDIGTLIYTSGTTGPPKAVQISHGALSWTADLITQLWKFRPTDRVISYLPLAHIAEQILTLHFQAAMGNQVYFAKSVNDLPQHLAEVRPHMFFGVPRVFEKMASAVQAKLAAATGPKAKLARWAMRVAREWHEREGKGLRGPRLFAKKALAHALVHKKIKRAMGFDEARVIYSAAAPISVETLKFMAGLDIHVRELWGLSESCGTGTVNLPYETKMGSVGRVTPGMEMKFTEDGEICIKGPGNFSGYAKDPEATARALVDGWLHTGDIGRMDEDGFVYITGRKKDIIITSGGKNIAPANIELDLVALPLVESAIVCGERRPYLTALLTLDAIAAGDFAERKGLTPDDPKLQELIREEIQAGVDAVNARHSRVEHVRRFLILRQPLSIEAGELTPTLKVRRAAVMKLREKEIEELYASELAG